MHSGAAGTTTGAGWAGFRVSGSGFWVMETILDFLDVSGGVVFFFSCKGSRVGRFCLHGSNPAIQVYTNTIRSQLCLLKVMCSGETSKLQGLGV